MTMNDLIHRYLLGLITDDEVRELETRLTDNDQLQDEFLLHAEIDAHLRQEAQSTAPSMPALKHEAERASFPRSTVTIWKWTSGISTIAASVLLILLLLYLPTPQTAWAYPSLGHLSLKMAWSEQHLWGAAADGDLQAIRRELKAGVSVNAQQDDGLTPLHVATLFGRQSAIDLLLSAGAEVSIADGEGNTALHMAAFLGYTDIVHVLLMAGADPAIRNKLGFNAGDLVGITWNPGLEDYYHGIERELRINIDLDQLRVERPRILKTLLESGGHGVDVVPTVSLWQAAMTGNTAAVKQHIAAGTALNQKEEFGGSTPLILAAIFGQDEVAQILIDAGADLDLQNNSGSTALHSGCFFCHPQVVELLLDAGADPARTNHQNFTPLQLVTIDLDAESEGVYRYVYDSLNMQLNLDHVRRTRTQIAELLQQHTAQNPTGNSASE